MLALWGSFLARCKAFDKNAVATGKSTSSPDSSHNLAQTRESDLFIKIAGKDMPVINLKPAMPALCELSTAKDEDCVYALAVMLTRINNFPVWEHALCAVLTLAEVESFLKENDITLPGVAGDPAFRKLLWGAVGISNKADGWLPGAAAAEAAKKGPSPLELAAAKMKAAVK
jgi:hypothetical protein